MKSQNTSLDDTFTKCYITNFPEGYTVSDLQNLFSQFGTPVSCRISINHKNNGSCTMSTHEEAVKAVNGLNNYEIEGHILHCSRALSRFEMKNAAKKEKYEKFKEREIFVHFFDDEVSNEELKEAFSQFGEVESVKVAKYRNGKSKKYGFVCYKTPEEAQECIKNSNLILIHEKQIQVEMTKEPGTKTNIQQMKLPDIPQFYEQDFQPNNEDIYNNIETFIDCFDINEIIEDKYLDAIYEKYKERLIYFQNFDETVTDDELKRVFSEFGEIEILKIVRFKNDKTKKFGFICYKKPEQANECIQKSIFIIIHDKQLYASKVMSKEEQLKQLQQKQQQYRPLFPMFIPPNNLTNPLDPTSNQLNMPFSPNLPLFPLNFPGIQPFIHLIHNFPSNQPAQNQFSQTLNTQETKSILICEAFPDNSHLIPRIMGMSDDQAKELENDRQLFQEFIELSIDQKQTDDSVSIEIIEQDYDSNPNNNDSNHFNEDKNEDGDEDGDYDDNETEFFKTEDREEYDKQQEATVKKESEMTTKFPHIKQRSLSQIYQQNFALQPIQPKKEEIYNNIETFIDCFDIKLKMEDYDKDNYLDEDDEDFNNKRYQHSDQTFTICNVTNFPINFTQSDINHIFSEFGKPVWCQIIYDDNEKSKQIGFCEMSNHEDAIKAVNGLNGHEINGFVLRCGRAKFISEREDIEKAKKRLNRAIDFKYKGRLIYFQNFDETVTDDELKRIFSEFGEIIIAKIIRDENDKTKQFGFICYKTPEQANECIRKSIFIMIHDKQLYTSKVMSKEEQLKQFQQKQKQYQLQFQNSNKMTMPQNNFNSFNQFNPTFNPYDNHLSPNFYPDQPFGNPIPIFIPDNKSMLISEAKGKFLDSNTLLQRINDMSDEQAKQLANDHSIFSKFLELSIDQEYKDVFAIIEHDANANKDSNANKGANADANKEKDEDGDYG